MIQGSASAANGRQPQTHRSLLANHPTLKGKDPVGMSSLPRMSTKAGAVHGAYEEPLAVLQLDSGAADPGSGSRVSRHLRDTVRMQRQADKAAGGGFTDDTLLSSLGRDIHEHTWAGSPVTTRTKKALMPSAPSTGQISSRRTSGVKLRSRSKPAGL